MKHVFADTAHWIAYVNPHDRLHGKALSIGDTLGKLHLITSHWVLTELLNYFSGRGESMRLAASRAVDRLVLTAAVVIVPYTDEAFWKAFEFYRTRHDKAWSLTDCSSFLIMQRYGIDSALTYDKHFEQTGFKALLR